MDVMSNAAFVVVGFIGLLTVWRMHDTHSFSTKLPWTLFFLSAAMVGVGSGYYHWAPDNATLFWDRLPMALAFMALVSGLLAERVHQRVGLLLLPILLGVGAWSVIYWAQTEAAGAGDLRPYALVQFGPMLFLPFLLIATRTKFHGNGILLSAFVYYALAKVTEHFDCEIYDLAQGIVSGHTIKHLFAAMGVYQIVAYVKQMHARRFY